MVNSIHRRILAIASPMILAGASGPLLGIVDTAILGHLDSSQYLSAVAIGASALALIFWLLSFLRMGTTGLTARAWGGQQPQQCRELLWQSLVLALVLGLLLLIVQWPLLHVVLWLLGPGAEIYQTALDYCQIRIWAAPATLCSYAAIGWLLGLQRARATLLVMATTNGVNIGLDFLFIVGLGLNSDGAAWASLIAEYLGLLLALYFIRCELKQLKGDVDPQQLLRPSTYKPLLLVNRDLFLRTACVVFVFTFFTAQGARLGSDIVAANAILMQLVLLVSYGLDGFAHAAESLTGHATGARKRRDFYAICRACTLWGALLAGFASLMYWLLQWPIIHMFTDLPHIARLTAQYYGWLVALPVIGFGCYMLDGILLGAGRTAAMRNTMFVAMLAFLGCWWQFAAWGNHGLWLAFSVFMGGRSALMAIAFCRLSKRNLLVTP